MPNRISYIGSGKEYVHYTDDELNSFRSIDMIDFLSRKEGFTFKQTSTYFKCVEHDSLVIYPNRTTWAWNSRQAYGKNALDWLQRVDGMTFQEACQCLSPLERSTDTQFIKTVSAKKPVTSVSSAKDTPLFIPEKTNGKYSSVFMYLTATRCIDADVVNSCFHDKLIYQDKLNNACFVGYDENHKVSCVTQRGTNTFAAKPFKGNTSGSNLEHSFRIPCDKTKSGAETNRVYVFEAPIDLLSHATLYKMVLMQRGETDPECWKRQNRLTLLGVSDVALQSYLKNDPNITEIVCCLDNDEAGREGARNIFSKYSDKYKVTVHCAKNAKDYNEVLCNYVRQLKNQQKTNDDNINNDVTYKSSVKR